MGFGVALAFIKWAGGNPVLAALATALAMEGLASRIGGSRSRQAAKVGAFENRSAAPALPLIRT